MKKLEVAIIWVNTSLFPEISKERLLCVYIGDRCQIHLWLIIFAIVKDFLVDRFTANNPS